jgi:plastocyanin
MRCVACVVLLCVTLSASAQPPAWVTLKGQVVFPADIPLPVPKAIMPQQPVPLCKNRPLIDESVIVNPKNRGVKNVVVWLRPDNMNPKAALAPNEIHPDDAKRKPAEVVIDQPCCQFEPRILAARAGDSLVVKNSATIVQNVFWVSDKNGNFNPNMPPGGEFRLPNPLVAEGTPIAYSCAIHPWMKGYVRVFDHPYFVVTDENGKFEIKNAPVGKYRLVMWHEANGFKDGKAGRFGDQIEIKDKMESKPVTWDVTK